MNAWSCEDCDDSPDEEASRGHCGGPFGLGLRQSEVDEEGQRFISGGVVVPIAAGGVREAIFYRCPLAEAMGSEGVVSSALALWRRSGGGANLALLLSKPSIAGLEAIEVIAGELEEIAERRRESDKG